MISTNGSLTSRINQGTVHMASMRQSYKGSHDYNTMSVGNRPLLMLYSHEKDYLFFIQMGITKHYPDAAGKFSAAWK